MKRIVIPSPVQVLDLTTGKPMQELVPGSLSKLRDAVPVTFGQYGMRFWLNHPGAFRGAEGLAAVVGLVPKFKGILDAATGSLDVEDSDHRKLLEAAKEPPENMSNLEALQTHIVFRQALVDAKDVTTIVG